MARCSSRRCSSPITGACWPEPLMPFADIGSLRSKSRIRTSSKSAEKLFTPSPARRASRRIGSRAWCSRSPTRNSPPPTPMRSMSMHASRWHSSQGGRHGSMSGSPMTERKRAPGFPDALRRVLSRWLLGLRGRVRRRILDGFGLVLARALDRGGFVVGLALDGRRFVLGGVHDVGGGVLAGSLNVLGSVAGIGLDRSRRVVRRGLLVAGRERNDAGGNDHGGPDFHMLSPC